MVDFYLSNLKTKDDLKEIVIEKWNYQPVFLDFPRSYFEKETQVKIKSCEIIAEHLGFQIVLFELDHKQRKKHQQIEIFMRTSEREIMKKIPRDIRTGKLYVFTADKGEYWHFVNVQAIDSRFRIRRFSVSPETRTKLRTTCQQLTEIETKEDDTYQNIVSKHETAFDVEAVTEKFYRDFANRYVDFYEEIEKTPGITESETRLETQMLLNRILFLYFIQRKGWLDSNYNYISEHLDKYRDYPDERNYYFGFLLLLFKQLSSQDYKNKNLGSIPFLNGGLFELTKFTSRLTIRNKLFIDLIDGLLEHYNFVVQEDTPVDVEVAIDPEMLGKIFENLVLKLEEVEEKEGKVKITDLRRATGSYYTPRSVVDFMSRQAIGRFLVNKTDIKLDKVFKLIELGTDDIPDETQDISSIVNAKQARILLNEVKSIRIVDPAVGSGAFLLSALHILVGLRSLLGIHTNDIKIEKRNRCYLLKEEVIQQNLHGVDIMRQAVRICELRLWLSLMVDYELQEDENPPKLPNLSFRIANGDSLHDKLNNIEIRFELKNLDTEIRQLIYALSDLKKSYFREYDTDKKEKINKNVNEKKHEIALEIIQRQIAASEGEQVMLFGEKTSVKDTIKKIKKVSLKKTEGMLKFNLELMKRKNSPKKPLDIFENGQSFLWHLDFVEIFSENNGFDVVLGNPPYGVKDEKVAQNLGLQSKDSYGIFARISVGKLLHPEGTMSFIMSDTWQTIKSHKPLRQFFLDSVKVHYVLMMPAWVFKQTVNTSVITLTKASSKIEFGKTDQRQKEREDNELIAGDFTRAEKNTTELEEYLLEVDKPNFRSTPKVAFYCYPQRLIKTYGEIPFFVGSPDLFLFLNDTTMLKVKNTKNNIDFFTRRINYKNTNIDIIKLGEIADVKKGLATGDNKKFYFKAPEGRGNYELANKTFILSDNEILNFTKKEKIHGVNPFKYNEKYLVPLDKGEECDSESSWLPNYYVQTKFFINWSKNCVGKIYKLRGMRNPKFQFKKGIAFSWTGYYAPTFRLNTGYVFDQSSSCIFQNVFSRELLLGLLTSKFCKYVVKTYIDHSVNSTASVVNKMIFPYPRSIYEKIESTVKNIISKQKKNVFYNYIDKEQKEIDELIYKSLNLNDSDKNEIEAWYARRYPKLVKQEDG